MLTTEQLSALPTAPQRRIKGNDIIAREKHAKEKDSETTRETKRERKRERRDK